MMSARTHFPRSDVALWLSCALLAYLLKHHYSVATAPDLWWILTPTTALVETVTGSPFVAEGALGYLSRHLHFVIAPSCAGINFLIVVFLTLVFGLMRTVRTLGGKIMLVLASSVVAYVAALLVNTSRIVIAIALHAHGPIVRWLSEAQVHRYEGVTIYFLALCLLFLAARALLNRRPDAPPSK